MARQEIRIWRVPNFENVELKRGVEVTHDHPRHWHEEFHMCLIDGGAGKLFYRGTHHETAASLFFVQPGEVHSNFSRHALGCSFLMVNVGGGWLERAAAELAARRPDTPFFKDPLAYDRETLAEFRELHSAFESSASVLERESRLLTFLVRLIARYSHKPRQAREAGKEPEAVRQAKEYLTENFADNVSLERLAALCRLSPFHLSRVFSEATGMPPHAFQIQVRLAAASKLLSQGRTISEAACETGFADQSHFTRHFKRIVGVTPGRFITESTSATRP